VEKGLDRLAWLERAIRETESFCEAVESTAEEERALARFDSVDYDFEVDLVHAAALARKTLALLEEERSSILARRQLRDERAARERLLP
jgi:hypothetical protein